MVCIYESATDDMKCSFETQSSGFSKVVPKWKKAPGNVVELFSKWAEGMCSVEGQCCANDIGTVEADEQEPLETLQQRDD
jgi:hypothetical protein